MEVGGERAHNRLRFLYIKTRSFHVEVKRSALFCIKKDRSKASASFLGYYTRFSASLMVFSTYIHASSRELSRVISTIEQK